MKTVMRTMLTVGLISLLVWLVACSRDDPTATPKPTATSPAIAIEPTMAPPVDTGPPQGGTLKLRISGTEPANFDPADSFQSAAIGVNSMLYNKLLQYNHGPDSTSRDFTIEGELAESWTVIDPVTYEFKLRQGVMFHDKPPVNGRELTSADVKYSIEKLRDSEGRHTYRYLYKGIADIETPDRYTVRFILTFPDAEFLDAMASPYSLVYAPEVEDMNPWENAVGTGPFIWTDWSPEVIRVLEANPNYWREGLPILNRVRYDYIADDNTALAVFRAGELDVFGADPQDIPFLEKIEGVSVSVQSGSGLAGINCRQTEGSICLNRDFRRALANGYNDDVINIAMRGGLAVKQRGPIPAIFPQYQFEMSELSERARGHYDYDPDAARQLLADAGYANGVDFELSGSSRWKTDDMFLVADMWTKVGIRTTVNVVDHTVFVRTVSNAGTDSDWLGANFSQVNGAFVNVFLSSLKFGARKNTGLVNDPAMEALIVQQAGTTDPLERRELIRQIADIYASESYRLPNVSDISIAAYQPWVQDYISKQGIGYQSVGNYMEYVWIDEDKRN